MGAYMLDRMSTWTKKYEIVGDVRGRGLMIGIELIQNKSSKERAPELRDKLEQLAFERGLLVLGAGPNTIRLCPPLVITKEQANFAMDTLEQCFPLLA
jgi:4-aminobutyrate aminotransferase